MRGRGREEFRDLRTPTIVFFERRDEATAGVSTKDLPNVVVLATRDGADGTHKPCTTDGYMYCSRHRV